MSKVKGENFFVVQGWMVTELKLKGNELLVYAIIYGFSQSGEGQRYTGSLQYLAEWINGTKQGVIKNLKSLVDKGFVGKEEKNINGVKFCEYYATQFNGVLNSVERGIKLSLTGGIQQSLPNNIDIDIDTNNIEDNSNTPTPPEPPKPEKPEKPVKHKYGEYKHVLLTDEEFQRLADDFGSMASEAIAFLDEYIEEKGYKSKSHNLAIRRWVINAVKEKHQKENRVYSGKQNGGGSNIYTLSNGEQTSNPFFADLDRMRSGV